MVGEESFCRCMTICGKVEEEIRVASSKQTVALSEKLDGSKNKQGLPRKIKPFEESAG